MRILIDECMPKKLKREFPDHTVATVREMGWFGKINGELLGVASGKFDVLITVDKNMPHQQNVAKLPIAVIVLKAWSNRLQDLLPLLPVSIRPLNLSSPAQ